MVFCFQILVFVILSVLHIEAKYQGLIFRKASVPFLLVITFLVPEIFRFWGPYLNTTGKLGKQIDGITGMNAQISSKYATYTTSISSRGHVTMDGKIARGIMD